jgi:hypothetical protein
MPRKLHNGIKEQVLAYIACSPGGIGIQALYKLLSGQISRRSLQRRPIRVSGRRETGIRKKRPFNALCSPDGDWGERGEVLRAIARLGRHSSWRGRPSGDGSLPPLSPSAAKVQRAVRKPITGRTPVGYNREFLDTYKPNESSYLTPETIAALNRVGRTPDSERPAGTYARHILARLLETYARFCLRPSEYKAWRDASHQRL